MNRDVFEWNMHYDVGPGKQKIYLLTHSMNLPLKSNQPFQDSFPALTAFAFNQMGASQKPKNTDGLNR